MGPVSAEAQLNLISSKNETDYYRLFIRILSSSQVLSRLSTIQGKFLMLQVS